MALVKFDAASKTILRLATGSLSLFRRGGYFAFIGLFAPRIFAIFKLNFKTMEILGRLLGQICKTGIRGGKF